MQYVSEDEFRSSCITYITWYKNAFAEFTALNMSAIMSDVGFECKKPGKRTRKYQGLQDMIEYYNDNMRIIKSLSEESRIHSYTLDSKWFDSEMQNENKRDTNSLFSIGIKEMDATIGELRRGNMLGIMGPPKGGKTRFTNFLVQRALSFGLNVCVWPLEGTSDEWLAMQIACYIAQTSYSEVKSGKKESMIRLSSKDILQKKYTNSVEMRKNIAAAKKVMATSEKYGRLSFIEGTAYVEDMFDVLEAHYENENQYDVLVIDQLVNVMSKKGKGKVERISEAYMETKNFIANRLKVPVLGIMPAQLKQDVVDFLRRNPDETIDVTSGGESAETVRTPDEVIGLFSSKEERDNNIMKIYSVASRHNGSFQDFQARCYLECCYFMSEDDEVK
jgi:archaellum biogenesis ATPase FlaH